MGLQERLSSAHLPLSSSLQGTLAAFGIRESIQAPQVHSIDWSYADPHSLVTASNDCTVKFHNVQGKRKDWQLKKQHPRKSHRDTLLFPIHQRSCLEGQVRLMICKKKNQ